MYAPLTTALGSLQRTPRWIWLGLAAIALFAVSMAAQMPTVHGERQKYDPGANARGAFHVANSGTFSLGARRARPDYNREPGFAVFLALPLKLFGETDAMTARDMQLNEQGLQPRKVLVTTQAAIIATLASATFLAAVQLGAMPMIAFALALAFALANYYRILPTHELFSEPFTALLLLLHSLLVVSALKSTHRTALVRAVGASLLLAALCLTKAIFLYYLYIFALALPIALLATRRLGRSKMLTLMLYLAMVMPAAALVGSYIARNKIYFGDAAITGVRDVAVLTCRAGFFFSTPAEMIAGFAFYFPEKPEFLKSAVTSALSGHFTEQDYLKHLRSNKRGFYRDWSRQYEYIVDYAQSNDIDYDIDYFNGTHKYITDQENQRLVRKAVVDLIASNMGRQLAVTTLMAFKQSFPNLHQWPTAAPDRLGWARTINEYLRLLFVPATVLVGLVLLLRRRIEVVFLVPAAFSFAGYAFLTHINQRYGAPLIPVYFICLALAFTWAWRWVSKRSGLPDSEPQPAA